MGGLKIMKNEDLQEIWRKAIMEIKVSSYNKYDPSVLAPGPHKGTLVMLDDNDEYYGLRVALYKIYEFINESYDPNKILETLETMDDVVEEDNIIKIDCREVSFTYFIFTSMVLKTSSCFDPSSYANRFSTAKRYDEEILKKLIKIFDKCYLIFDDVIELMKSIDPTNELNRHLEKQHMTAKIDIQRCKDIHTW